MIRDQAILVRPDGSVMFDSPARRARQGVESRDAWLTRTVGKAAAEQSKRGVTLTMAERIAPEERPHPLVRDSIRMGRDGKLTVDLEAVRALLSSRYQAEAAWRLGRLRARAEAAAWFSLGAGLESPGVVVWERRLAAVESEARRMAAALAAARTVEDLIAMEPRWPEAG